MGLHPASDGGGDPDEEEEEERLSFPEAPGQGPPLRAEEPIECLPSGQNFQLQTITVTLQWLFNDAVSIETEESLPQLIASLGKKEVTAVGGASFAAQVETRASSEMFNYT